MCVEGGGRQATNLTWYGVQDMQQKWWEIGFGGDGTVSLIVSESERKKKSTVDSVQSNVHDGWGVGVARGKETI